jgi:hypothetical protein
MYQNEVRKEGFYHVPVSLRYLKQYLFSASYCTKRIPVFDNPIWPTFDTFICPTLRLLLCAFFPGFVVSVAPAGAKSCGPSFGTTFRTERTTRPRSRMAAPRPTRYEAFFFWRR